MRESKQHRDWYVLQVEQRSGKDWVMRKSVSERSREELLDEALKATFPASDPVASMIFE